jgi:hypothetical protein
MRWRLAIQEFAFSVAYIKGEKNNVADALSRCLPNPKTDSEDDTQSRELRSTTLDYLTGRAPPLPKLPNVPDTWYESIDREDRKQYFIPNEDYLSFLGLLDGTPSDISPSPLMATDCDMCPKQVRREQIPYCLLCPITSDKHELVAHEEDPLPTSINELIERCHNAEVGHGGVDRTLELLTQLRLRNQSITDLPLAWTTTRADVKRFIKKCPICQKVKQHQLLKYTPHFTVSTYGIFDNISIDTVYMPESTRGNKYLLVIIDSFSRYLDVYPIADLTAMTAMTCLIQFMGNFGIPSHLCCDNGSQFQGMFQDLLDLLHVNGYKTHPYSHQENSIVERANKEILTVLRCLVLEKKLRDDWDILCHVAKRIINSRVHSSIGISPADLVFAGRIDLQRGSLFPYKVPESFSGAEYMTILMQHQNEMLRKATVWQNDRNRSRLQTNDEALKTSFPIHSYVLVKPEVESTNKLAPPWLGPYLVTERFERREGDIYRCLHLSTNREFDFRVDRINPFYFDDEATLQRTAALDKQEYEVEAVLNHHFDGAHSANTLHLEIKWIGYDKPEWQPFNDTATGLKEVGIVHEYLRSKKLARFIPARFK